MNGWMNGRINKIDGSMDECLMDIRIDGWMNIWMVGVDIWIDRQVNGECLDPVHVSFE